MPTQAIRNAFRLARRPLIDRWLRFAPAVQAFHDRETVEARRRELRTGIFLGLVLYNIYNLTSLALLPDVFWLSVMLRVGLVTPVSLGLVWVIGRAAPQRIERLVLAGTFNAYLLPVFLFWLTASPLGLFTFGELLLTIVFATMLLALRFPQAVVFMAAALAVTLLAVATKPGVDDGLRFAFVVQIVTACLFGLYANYRSERRRCADYLAALGERLRAEAAEMAGRQFHDLSRTDALTEIPNRRFLLEQLGDWFARSEAVVVMMVDIDHFKLYNDALGHPAGDDCLRQVAGFLCVVERPGETFCARFGGEEFAICMRAASELDAVRLARALVTGIETLALPHPSRRDGSGSVTISVGIARKAPGVHRTPADLLAEADRALYEAKQRGRNQFVLATGERSGAAYAG